jgi:hypothetical protein
MRTPSVICGMLGILAVILAIVGRFYGQPAMTLFGITTTATHVLTVANTLLLIGLFLGQWQRTDKKP